MRKSVMPTLVLAATGLVLAIPSSASAHNRGHVILPSGECIIVGSEEGVPLPDGTLLDLRPETPADEIGTAFAAEQGNSRVQKGPCP